MLYVYDCEYYDTIRLFRIPRRKKKQYLWYFDIGLTSVSLTILLLFDFVIFSTLFLFRYLQKLYKMSTPPRETIQKQIQQDWANREYIEVITGSIKKITDFLNSFGE